MRVSTACNHKNRLKEKLKDIYRSAKIWQWHTNKLISEKNKLFQDPAYKKVPEWVRSFLSGYSEALWELHWTNVKWVLPFEGVNYNNWGDLPEEGKEAYRKGMIGKHIYKDKPNREFT